MPVIYRTHVVRSLRAYWHIIIYANRHTTSGIIQHKQNTSFCRQCRPNLLTLRNAEGDNECEIKENSRNPELALRNRLRDRVIAIDRLDIDQYLYSISNCQMAMANCVPVMKSWPY